MKIQILREALLTPLGQLSGVIEKRQTQAVLGNILMRVVDQQLELTATDGELELRARLLPEILLPGATTVPARKLLDIVRLMPEGSLIQIEALGERCQVKSGGSRFHLATLPVESFPAFDPGSVELRFTLAAKALRTAVEKTAFAIAQQDIRPYLKGLLIDVEGQVLRTVASDGHRLAVYQETLTEAPGVDAQFIVPRKAVSELLRLFAEEADTVTMERAATAMSVHLGSLRFSSKLIEGRYPDFRRVFPETLTTELTLGRDAFRGALSRVGLMTSEKQKSISLETQSGGSLLLTGRSADSDEAEERLPVHWEGAPVLVGFNAAYLNEAIGGVAGPELRLSFSEGGHSSLVEDPDDPRYRCVVMPMRV